MQEWRMDAPAMTFDEVSMERSKNFVKALQELKNLRPQLYSAAEYCEKSYLRNEQKQMVLDNLKDYAVRAVVNAVDHLGTVAYKLTDLFEQQTVDVSTLELKISCLNQRILTCQTYIDKEGLRQQQLLVASPKHHKHYILPNSGTKRSENNSQQTDASESHFLPKARPYPPGTPASKSLSCLLAAETNASSNREPGTTTSSSDSEAFKTTTEAFHLLDAGETAAQLLLSTHLQSGGRTPLSNKAMRSFGVKDHVDDSKHQSAIRLSDNAGRIQVYRPPIQNKSRLAAFFTKNKALKQKKALVC